MENFPSPMEGRAKEIRSVSGAGDCLNAGFISGLLQGLSLKECALKGTACARESLKSILNVPSSF
jgi:sugar/nucleoside kinase (ribokinase family)